MVRAGVVKHPQEWNHSGYNEIQKPKQRYGLIDFKRLIKFLPIESQVELKEAHQEWIDKAFEKSQLVRQNKWTQSIAVGDQSFVKKIKKQLGYRSKGRKIIEENNDYQLREWQIRYGDVAQNLYRWDLNNTATEAPLS
jgi:putative transposase